MKNSTYKALQPDGIDGKEVNGDHARRLGAEELAPCWTRPLPRRTEVLLTQDLLHRGRRHDHTEAFQFAHDTLIAPARVFACESNDQHSNLTVDRRATGSSSVGPAFRHQTPMPSQKRRRRDKKRRPFDPRQHPSRGPKKPSVG